MDPRKLYASIALAVSLFLGGLYTGYRLYRPGKVVKETPAAEQTIPGGKILARDPDRKLPPPAVTPKGGKLERQVQVDFVPRALEPMRLDLSMFRLTDGSHRVEVTSPTGTILGGVDVPIDPQPPPKVLKWAVGGIYGPKERGLFVDRDMGPFRLGLEAVIRNQDAYAPRSAEWRAKLGFRF